MHALRLYLLMALLMWLCSCGANNGGHATSDSLLYYNDHPVQQQTDTPTHSNTAPKKEPYEYPKIEPRSIAGFTQPAVVLESPFRPDEALKRLFPGRYYHLSAPYEDDSALSLEAWRCKSCPEQWFETWFGEGKVLFPEQDGQMTQWADTLCFTDDSGRRNIFISFSSLQVQQIDFINCGRMTCAILGLAWFTDSGGVWKLKNFAPGLGCYGAFQSLPKIHLIRFARNNYGCYLRYANGGAGGPYFEYLFVFGLLNGRFKTLLTVPNASRTNGGGSEWRWQLKDAAADTGFGDLPLTIKGTCLRDIEANEYDPDSPEELQKKRPAADSFGFAIYRQYHFSRNSYRLLKSRTQAPLKR